MKPVLSLLALGALALAACSQAQTSAPATQPQAPAFQTPANAVTLDLGAVHGRTASLVISTPPDVSAAAYTLQTASVTVYHWVAADITSYDVTLKSAATSAGPFLAIGSGVTLSVPTGKTEAVFTNLVQGQYYRGFVAAMGRKALSADPIVQLNTATALTDYADFDFTAVQDVNPVSTPTPVLIHFDGVAFNGTGNVTFASPADGVFATPSAGPVGRATTTPLPG